MLTEAQIKEGHIDPINLTWNLLFILLLEILMDTLPNWDKIFHLLLRNFNFNSFQSSFFLFFVSGLSFSDISAKLHWTQENQKVHGFMKWSTITIIMIIVKHVTKPWTNYRQYAHFSEVWDNYSLSYTLHRCDLLHNPKINARNQ